MRLSVLLPTRNGGPFLGNCITSVLAQPSADLELVVSDNANTDQTASVISEFTSDPRLRVVRLDTPVTVTENWNRALAASRGDYLLMIGDDDYLLPSYLEVVTELLDRHRNPDCLTYNAYSYVFPDAIRGLTDSHYADPHFRFGPRFSCERELSLAERRQIVLDMYRFVPRIPLNMQTTLVARRALERLRNGLFRAPFPDHYALNALLLSADRWVFAPKQPLVVGVSLKSFGHFVYSDQPSQGLDYLGIETSFRDRLPGNELLNAMCIWLQHLKQDYPDLLVGVEPSRPDYVVRQLKTWYTQTRLGRMAPREALRRIRLLTPRDWLALVRGLARRENLRAAVTHLRIGRGDHAQQLWYGLNSLPDVDDIAGFADWLDSRETGYERD